MNERKDWSNYAILSDMDGVIISLQARWIDPFEQVISSVKPDYDKQAIIDSISSLLVGYAGKSKLIMLKVLYTACRIAGLSIWQTFLVTVKLSFMLITRKKFKIVPLEGVLETLEQLKNMGFKLALVTTASSFTVRRLKRKHPEIYYSFDAVFSRNDVKLTKPFPDQLLLALDKLSVPPKNAVMCGDLLTDIQAGKSAGVKTIAVLTEFPEIGKMLLEGIDPDFIVDSFSDVPKLIPAIFTHENMY